MRTLIVALLFSAFAFGQRPLTDEEQLQQKAKEMQALQAKVEAKAKARAIAESSGMECKTLDSTAAGTNITCTFTGDDSVVLGGPVESYLWTVDGLPDFHANGKTMTATIPDSAADDIFSVHLIELADKGHKQQSHKVMGKKQSPFIWYTPGEEKK